MKMLVVNRKIPLSIFVMLMLIWGISGVSYGEDDISILDAKCEGKLLNFDLGAQITVTGTIRANKDVNDVTGWLTINGQRIHNGIPAFPLPTGGFSGGESFGDLLAGESKPFKITESVLGAADGDTCGFHFEWSKVEDNKKADPTPVVEPQNESGLCQVGDVLSPGESCTDPGTGDDFTVLDDGRGRYLFFTSGTGISLRGNINGKQRNFIASKRADGKWEIKSVTGEDAGGGNTNPPPERDPTDAGTTQQPKTSNPKLSFSTASPLTEATLHESIVTLTLSGGTYVRSRIDIGDALTVSGIEGVTTSWLDVERISDTEITVELEFEGDFDVDAILTFTLGENALANYNGPALTTQIPVSGGQESIVASTAQPLTEATLDGSVVTLTLSGGTYVRSRIDIGNALTVSGIEGVTTSWLDVERISDTEITVELEFAGNIDTDSTLTFTVDADALANYKGPALTTELRISALTEWIVAATAVPLTAATLDGSVVTLTLSGGSYERWPSRNAVKVSGITGVTLGGSGLNKISDAEATVELEYDGNTDRIGTLIFTVAADAIKNYEGPALTAHLAVPTHLKQGPKGDVNGDGAVSIQDLILVASSFGKTGQHPADANGDGNVDIKDLILIAGVLDAGPAAPSLYSESLEILTPAALQLWLSQAHHLALRDATSQRGIRFLEQLLAVLIPKETALLANYPNPFNPETWIPYQLAKDAEVTLTIYGVNGQIVRRLSLGHQPAGVYQSRSRAAYWDGKNAFGEPVASGLYFYTLTAGDFAATRKMLIRK